jgi:hypothetical protein
MEGRFDNPQSVPPEWLWALDGVRPEQLSEESSPSDSEFAPGAADWARSPSAERLRERLERHDAQMTSALHDVPVPSGLDQRVLTVIQQELATQPLKQKHDNYADTSTARPRSRMTRRAAWIGLAAAIAGAAFVAVQLLSTKKSEFTPTSLMEAAIARFVAESNQPLANHDLKDAPPAFPISGDIMAQAARWRWIDDPWLGRRGVAYDVSVGDGAVRATLFVMQGSIDGLIESPPPNPSYPPTQGSCAAAWQSGGLVYVLVVQGKEAEYQRFLRHPGGPIA